MSSEPRKVRAQIERTAQDRIGRQLRAMYSELVRQPLPERLLATLSAIHAEEGSQRLAEEELPRAA